MTTSHQRRKTRKAEAAKASLVAYNVAPGMRFNPRPKALAGAPAGLPVIALASKSARFNDPIGAVFKARNPTAPVFVDTRVTDFDGGSSNLRPIFGFVKRLPRFKRWGRA